MRILIIMAFCIVVGASGPGYAQTDSTSDLNAVNEKLDALNDTVQRLQQTLDAQQRRIEQLERENESLRGDDPRPEPLAAKPLPPAQSRGGLQSLNPEIAVVVDIVGTLTESREDAEGNDRFSAREIELVLGQEVDTYGRLDLTVTLSDFEEVGIEDAYFTYWALPWDLKARLGRFRPKIGKANPLHRGQLDTVDEPLVVQRYLGVEGFSRTGIEVSRFLPQVSENLTHEITLGVLEGGIGEDGTLFGETRRRPTYHGRLRNFWDLGATSSLELGGSYLAGASGPTATTDVQAVGADLTFTHHFDAIRRLKFQNEWIGQFRRDPLTAAADREPWGVYSLLDYRLSNRWGIGGRYDWVELADNDVANPDDRDQAYSAYLTFFQSEFARIRAQYQHVDFATGGDDERFFLQFTYVMGVDKHPIQ